MHTIHHTEAIILRSEPSGEANKRLWLFTKEFGLLVVMVQGVRKPEAKLQSQLSDYSVIDADLLKGRNSWRLVSARIREVVLRDKTRSVLSRGYVRTIALLERFLTGEGANTELFDHVIDCGALVQHADIDPRAFDVLSLWKALALLGYAATEADDEQFFTMPFEQAVRSVGETQIKQFIKSATDAISYSHL